MGIDSIGRSQEYPLAMPLLLLRTSFLLLITLAHLGLNAATEIPWPKDYVVANNSESPDGHYAVLIPTRDSVDADLDDAPNYLVDVRARRVVLKLADCHYSQGRNHSGLTLIWSDDSMRCIVELEGRFGFRSISAVETNGFIETPIGASLQKFIDNALSAQAGTELSGETTAYYRHGPSQQIRVRAISTTNPKAFDDQKTYLALFQGTFDLKTKQWVTANARTVDNSIYDAADIAYGPHTRFVESFTSDESKLGSLDQRLNDVFRVVRFILSPEHFGMVKRDQIEWLKRRESLSSIHEQCKFYDARIRALQAMLW